MLLAGRPTEENTVSPISSLHNQVDHCQGVQHQPSDDHADQRCFVRTEGHPVRAVPDARARQDQTKGCRTLLRAKPEIALARARAEPFR